MVVPYSQWVPITDTFEAAAKFILCDVSKLTLIYIIIEK